MSEALEILAQDLRVLEAMCADMGAYLASEATHWPMNKEGMPKLTIGGCLMRQMRLQALRNKLAAEDQEGLDTVIDSFNDLLKENVVRFESRAHDELYARLREWTTYLRNTSSQMAREREHYANTVDTRIVITAIMDKLQAPPYKLNPQVAQDVTSMDNFLKAQWLSGDFVLPEVWVEAYPADKYWWLYGHPNS